MHRVGERMPISQWFVRPRYVAAMRTDIDKFRHGILDEPQKDMPRLDEIEQRMLAWMDSLGESPEHFGMIHGDLWIMNVLVHNGEIRLVDPMYCGWGYYLADLHKPMWARFSFEQAEAYLTGYQEIRPLPDGWREGLALMAS